MSGSEPLEKREDFQTDYVYLALDNVLEIYGELFGCTPIEAADQLRDRGGLEGALARARSYAAYGNADVATQAAALAHGVAEGQYFVEGNKRIALITFLRINGYDLTASQHERAMWILDLSAGLTVLELAARIRDDLIVRILNAAGKEAGPERPSP